MLHSPTRINPHARLTLIVGAAFMFVGVLLGAFGAHGLKHLDPSLLNTWETGARYLLLHAVALLALGVFILNSAMPLRWPRRLLIAGVLLFSGNCFIYVLSGVKFFAIIVPIGGTLLLAGWAAMLWELCFYTRKSLDSK